MAVLNEVFYAHRSFIHWVHSKSVKPKKSCNPVQGGQSAKTLCKPTIRNFTHKTNLLPAAVKLGPCFDRAKPQTKCFCLLSCRFAEKAREVLERVDAWEALEKKTAIEFRRQVQAMLDNLVPSIVGDSPGSGAHLGIHSPTVAVH